MLQLATIFILYIAQVQLVPVPPGWFLWPCCLLSVLAFLLSLRANARCFDIDDRLHNDLTPRLRDMEIWCRYFSNLKQGGNDGGQTEQ